MTTYRAQRALRKYADQKNYNYHMRDLRDLANSKMQFKGSVLSDSDARNIEWEVQHGQLTRDEADRIYRGAKILDQMRRERRDNDEATGTLAVLGMTAEEAGKEVRNAGRTVANTARTGARKAGEAAATVGKTVREVSGKVGEAAREGVAAAKEGARRVGKAVREGAGKVKNAGEVLVEKGKVAGKRLAEKGDEVLTEVGQRVRDVGGKIGEAAERGRQKVGEVARRGVDTAGKAVDSARRELATAGEAAEGFVYDTANRLGLSDSDKQLKEMGLPTNEAITVISKGNPEAARILKLRQEAGQAQIDAEEAGKPVAIAKETAKNFGQDVADTARRGVNKGKQIVNTAIDLANSQAEKNRAQAEKDKRWNQILSYTPWVGGGGLLGAGIGGLIGNQYKNTLLGAMLGGVGGAGLGGLGKYVYDKQFAKQASADVDYNAIKRRAKFCTMLEK